MKKLMTLGTALALALTLSAAGCKKKPDDATKTDNQKPVDTKGSAAPTPDPAAGSAAAPATGSAAPTDPATGSAAPATGSAAPAATTGVPECDEYLATVEKAATCDKFGPSIGAVQKAAEAWKASVATWSSLDAAALKAAQTNAAATCKASSDGVKQTGTGVGCTF